MRPNIVKIGSSLAYIYPKRKRRFETVYFSLICKSCIVNNLAYMIQNVSKSYFRESKLTSDDVMR